MASGLRNLDCVTDTHGNLNIVDNIVNGDDWLALRKVTTVAQVSITTLYYHCRCGSIRAYQFPGDKGQWMIYMPAALARWGSREPMKD